MPEDSASATGHPPKGALPADAAGRAVPLAVSLATAGQLLSIGRSSLKALIASRDVRSFRVGRRRLIRLTDLAEYIARRCEAEDLESAVSRDGAHPGTRRA